MNGCFTNSEETEVVTFDTDLAAGITVRPGDRIKIADPVRAGQSVLVAVLLVLLQLQLS